MGVSNTVVKGFLPHLTKNQRRDFASCFLHMPATVPALPWWHCVCLYGWKEPGPGTENRARVDQSRESSRNSSLLLCRRSVNRVLMCPSEVSHQPCYFQPLQEREKIINHNSYSWECSTKSILFKQSCRGYTFLPAKSLPCRPKDQHRKAIGGSLGWYHGYSRMYGEVLSAHSPPSTSHLCFIELEGKKSPDIWKRSPF